MRLRKQLLLVSLVTLAVPWAGVQVLQELEQALREGQLSALRATGKALGEVLRAADLSEGSVGLSDGVTNDVTDGDDGAQPIVVHPLPVQPIVDGYFDDWRHYEWQAQSLQPGAQATAASATLVAGEHQSLVYFYLTVVDPSRQFFIPATSVDRADHAVLELPGRGRLKLFSAAPGLLSTGWSGALADVPAYAVKGHWHEDADAYHLEWQLPVAWLDRGLRIGVHDGVAGREVLQTRNASYGVVRQSARLNAVLEAFVEPGVRIYVVNLQGYLRADAGALLDLDQGDYPGIVHKLVKWLLGREPAQQWHDAGRDGHLSGHPGQPIAAQLHAHQALGRNGNTINRAFVRVETERGPQFIVLDKNSSSVDALVTGVTGTVFWYSLLASLAAGAICVLYASLLSLRIRRLAKTVEQSMDAEGKLRLMTARSAAQDEIGDLARSYTALLQKLKDYTDYLQGLGGRLSHELRTPLAVIKSSMENLQQTPLSDQGKAYADRALAGAERLGSMLQAMSAAHRLEQSLQTAQHEWIDLQAMFSELLQAYRSAYPARQFALTTRGGEPWAAFIAPDLIAQMMDKLIENAVEFARAGSVIDILLEARPGTWCIEVANTGEPVPEAQLEKIFDSMTSARTSALAAGHLGLGLYLVRLIVAHHQGRVQAINQLAQGRVIFQVLLPRADAPR